MDKHDDNLIWEAYTIGSEDEYPKRMAPRANKETTIEVLTPDFLRKGDSFKKFLVFWVILTIVFYSLAGEKMPWLTVNIILPMIILTSVFSGDVFEKIYRKKLILRFNIFAFLIPIIILFTIFSLLITNWSNLNI